MTVNLRAPAFWTAPPGVQSTLLNPIAAVVSILARQRRGGRGGRVPVPVLCCGNLSVGGAGKTTVALDLGQRLRNRHVAVHFLTRGYGRRASRKGGGPIRVDSEAHTARDVGDEALLLARVAPCWVCADRLEAARAAVAAGAACLIMDDGFQNPTLHKDVSLLVIDGAVGFGNGQVLPAGPLREPLDSGLAAADAVLVIGDDTHRAEPTMRGLLRPGTPVLHARLRMDAAVDRVRGQRVIAFAGLARPAKFFDALRTRGVTPVRCIPFPDHHPYSRRDVARLARLAAVEEAMLVTTPKDAVKLPPSFRHAVRVLGVELDWETSEMPEQFLDQCLSSQRVVL